MAARPYDAALDGPERSFERFAGAAALATAAAGLGYALAFIVFRAPLPASVFLLLSGLLATPVLTAVYQQLRGESPGFAAWAALLALVGALGAAIHGGYDLANVVQSTAVPSDVPNAVDPRGLLTFGVAGLGFLVIGALIVGNRQLPPTLGYVAALSGVLLVILYLGRLVVLDPASPVILVPALLNGFVVSPVLYGWLGVALLRARPR